MITLIDTIERRNYDDFVEYCKDENYDVDEKELVIPTENSDEYISWCSAEREFDIECFFDNIKYLKNIGAVVVTGSLGLWNGRYDIYITPILHGGEHYKNALERAMYMCLENAQDFKVTYDDEKGYFEVCAYHHDGRNSFTIYNLSEKGNEKMAEEMWQPFEEEFNEEWITNFNISIEEL